MHRSTDFLNKTISAFNFHGQHNSEEINTKTGWKQ